MLSCQMVLKQVTDVSFDGLNLSQISRKYYAEEKKPITFDFKTAMKIVLNGEIRTSDPHYLHYYPGRIFPYIPLYMLSLSDFAGLSGKVLDPFAGSGTILLESITNPFIKRSAIGVDKNPIGRLMSKVKTKPLDLSTIDELTDSILIEYNKLKNIINEIPEFKNRKMWLSDKALERLSKLKRAIKNACFNQDYTDFFWLCFSSTIRKVSKANPFIPPLVVLKPEKYKDSKKTYEKLKKLIIDSEDPDVLRIFKEVVMKNRNKLMTVNNSIDLKNNILSEIIWDDAKKIKKGKLLECGRFAKEKANLLESGSVDIVLTSPPYLTAQKYIRTNKLELFCLGYSEEEVRSLDKSSIGTESISMMTKISSLDVETIDEKIAYIRSCSHERALQVFQYCRDMIESLREIHRLLRKNSFAILVIGDNRVLKRNMETFRLLTDAAVSIGFEELVILKDNIRSYSMPTKRNGTGGIIKNEYVIVLRKD